MQLPLWFLERGFVWGVYMLAITIMILDFLSVTSFFSLSVVVSGFSFGERSGVVMVSACIAGRRRGPCNWVRTWRLATVLVIYLCFLVFNLAVPPLTHLASNHAY